MTRQEKNALHRLRLEETSKSDPKVLIHLGGKDYFLEYTNRAVKDVMVHLGVNLLKDPFKLEDMQDPERFAKILFLGLRANHPDLTEDSMDDLITVRMWPYMMGCINTATQLFMADLSDIEENQSSETTEGKDPMNRPTLNGSNTGASVGV